VTTRYFAFKVEPMDKEVYRITYELEDTHWYFVGTRKLVLDKLTRLGKARQSRLMILDAGCGSGALMKVLEDRGTAVGIDISEEAMHYSGMRGVRYLVQGSTAMIPFKDSQFDVVFSIDVLYHQGVEDDVVALRELHRVLKEGGALVMNLPAYNFLFSSHDRVVHTRSRYTRAEITGKLCKAGFTIRKATYRNSLLFPLVLAVRVIKSVLSSGGTDIQFTPGWLNGLLTSVLKLENGILKFINLPFGSAVFCVAEK
jgi:SAM-dependent methyltransferase